MRTKALPISEIMTKQVKTLSKNASLLKAEELFKKHNIKHAPVVSGDKIVGMLSLTDLQRLSFVDGYNDRYDNDFAFYTTFTVGQIMMGKPVKVTSDVSIAEAALLLADKTFSALPVVENERLVGIITTTDLLRFFGKAYSEE